jgi:hypothetical protein
MPHDTPVLIELLSVLANKVVVCIHVQRVNLVRMCQRPVAFNTVYVWDNK